MAGPQQPEPSVVVIGHQGRPHQHAVCVGDGGGGGFQHQISDGQDKALVVDDDAVAGAHGAQMLHRPGVLGDHGAYPDNGLDDVLAGRIFGRANVRRLPGHGRQHDPQGDDGHRGKAP